MSKDTKWEIDQIKSAIEYYENALDNIKEKKNKIKIIKTLEELDEKLETLEQEYIYTN